MALIPLFHVVADEHVVDTTTPTEMIMGSFVTLTADGASLADGNDTFVYGIAGDTYTATSTAGIPSTNDAIIGASNVTNGFVNRVSDPYDETKASGKMTIYHGGGKFASDQYNTALTYVAGEALYIQDADGLLSNVASTSGVVVGHVITEGELPTGVPGITVDNDTSFGEFLTFKLAL